MLKSELPARSGSSHKPICKLRGINQVTEDNFAAANHF